MTRVALVHRDLHQLTRGGICTVYKSVARQLAARGAAVTLITQHSPHPLQISGVTTVSLPRTENLTQHREGWHAPSTGQRQTSLTARHGRQKHCTTLPGRAHAGPLFSYAVNSAQPDPALRSLPATSGCSCTPPTRLSLSATMPPGISHTNTAYRIRRQLTSRPGASQGR